MQQSSIPICHFPSTAVFLDDNRDFLLNFVLQLDESVAYRTFDDAFAALDYINNYQSETDSLSQHCLSSSPKAQNSSQTHRTIDLELAAIHREIYNPNRFSEISVLVVDYAMPGMNGLEFCRRVNNKKIKKILLSGQADEHLAISAFNEGLIDRYVKKSDVDAAEQITASLVELQRQYFSSMSDTITSMLSASSPSCMHDENFANFFHDFCQTNRIVEYYLMDNSGSYLLLNEDADVSFFLLRNKEDLIEFSKLSETNGMPQDLVQAVQSGKKIPFIYYKDKKEVNTWKKNLTDATEFNTPNQAYYYAHLASGLPFSVREDKILSYYRYLEELDAEALLTS